MDNAVDINIPPHARHKTLYTLDMVNQQLLIGALVGLIVGGVAGWFLGSYQTTQSINKQIAAEQAQQETVNPFEDVSTNPLEDVKTNPYESVKTNPFE